MFVKVKELHVLTKSAIVMRYQQKPMTTLLRSRRSVQAAKFLAGTAVGILAFAGMATRVAAQSSWSPTLLVNTEAFQVIDDGDGASNIELRFGTSSQTLKFLTTGKFQFSHSISVLGNISGTTLRIDGLGEIQGPLAVSGAVRTESNLTINDDADSNNAVLTFGSDSVSETLTWLNSADKFQLSDDLSVIGTLSGSILRVDGNADINGALAVSGSVLTESNLTINGDADSNNAVLTFGSDSVNETITWANSNDRFEFSDDVLVNGSFTAVGVISGSTLRVSGNADVQGNLTASGTVRMDGSTLTINDDQTAGDVALTFGSDGTNESVTWLNTADKFYLSDDLDVNGTLSGTTLKIWGNGNHTLSGSVIIENGLSGSTIQGFGLGDCNGTNQKLVYNASTDKFECATDNTGAGSNGSGQIISLHPEYAGAIYFSSGAAFVGQMTLSGGTTALDNTYRWSSSNGTIQNYWISTRVRLPNNFSSWDPTRPIELRYKTGVASNANNHVTMRMRDTAGALVTLTNGDNLANTAFTTATITGPEASGTWTPGGYVTIYVKLAANNTASAYAAAGFINLKFENTLP